MDDTLFSLEDLARYVTQSQPAVSAPAPDPAPNRTYQKIGRPFVWGGNAADLGSTAWVKAQDGRAVPGGTLRASESNPLLGENMLGISLAKLGAAAAEDYLLTQLSKTRPTLARNMGILIGAVNGGVAARNVRQAKRAMKGGE